MNLIRLIPTATKIDFFRWRIPALYISGLLTVLAIAAFLVFGLNYGVDFRGGILIEARTEGPANLSQMRSTLGELGLGEVTLQEFGRADDVLIRVQRQEGDEAAQAQAVEKVKQALGDGYTYRRVEFVGPKVGEELIRDGVLAVALALCGILIYVWFRFEWQFGVGAILATVHDLVMTIGLFAVLGLEFNLTSVAAILTIAGYSINDTVVVYDRVRENLRKYKSMPLGELINLSINETLSRTILTSGTTLIAVLALFLFGGDVIHGFSLAMIWGILVGTYSSIWIGAPFLYYFGLKRSRTMFAESGVAEPDGSR